MTPTKPCPSCGGEILAVAKKCKHCKNWIIDARPSDASGTTPKPPALGSAQKPSRFPVIIAALVTISVGTAFALMQRQKPSESSNLQSPAANRPAENGGISTHTPSPERLPELTAAPAAAVPTDSAAEVICRDLSNSYQCAQAIEKSVLAAATPSVVRAGRNLRIALERGGTVVFTDTLPGDVAVVRYSYRGQLTAPGYHVIEVQYYEGGTYLLVNRRTGWIGFSDGVPVVSPDSSRLAAGNVDFFGFSPTTLQIWRVATDSLVSELRHDFVSSPVTADSAWGPRDLAWLTPTELRVVREFSMGTTGSTARVVRRADGWRILVP